MRSYLFILEHWTRLLGQMKRERELTVLKPLFRERQVKLCNLCKARDRQDPKARGISYHTGGKSGHAKANEQRDFHFEQAEFRGEWRLNMWEKTWVVI